jgi:uncharacterized membrane protein (DUF4010 family)
LITLLTSYRERSTSALVAQQMAVLFQAVLFAVHAVRSHWGETGLLFSGAVLGFTDVDVLPAGDDTLD